MIKTLQASQLDNKVKSFQLNHIQIGLLEAAVILAFAFLPIFLSYPYRINIFLSWEGAYRLYMGHIPYKDFGLPMGYAYWLIPALFFKLFGPYLFTLVKAQVFLNCVAGLAFRSVLQAFNIESGKRLVLIVFFCLTYLFFNFWPWYNQSVFIFELIGIAFLMHGFNSQKSLKRWVYLSLAGFFVVVSFLTKQDGGGLAFVLCTVLAAYMSIAQRKLSYLLVFIASVLLSAAALILPFVPHDFLYWFNYGQEPHYSRMSIRDILNEFFSGSQWIKFYAVVISLLYINKLTHWRDIFKNKSETLFYLLCMGILVQASIIQVTSYIPADNNIYFHSFALAYALHAVQFKVSFNRVVPLAASIVMIFFWWSGTYYKYVQKVVNRYLPETTAGAAKANIVSKNTYTYQEKKSVWTGVNVASWIELPGSKAFARVYMPKETVAGIQKLKAMPEFNSGAAPKVLNMTELTPLSHELGFELEKGTPLWYHLNVSFFDRELKFYKERISKDYYDVVLFEYIPDLNNFYPFELRDHLKQEYQLIDTFPAPRQQNNTFIEVYVKNK
ncbi:hypothetical protein [Cesiribacter sp. SM1]|uniref:hypothetical protein n=1 Tax=Cesiribacter sp. SM1 TaxID=2861196 RepID=UPI001CD28F36|nr:hypothetical protein [Cesiribacter sp. SM1]